MTTGADLDAMVLHLAKLYGWRCQHVRNVTIRHPRRRGPDVFSHQTPIDGDTGAPDWLLVRAPRVLFIETKGDRDKLRPEQVEWRAALEACPGVEYVALWPKDAPKLIALLAR